MTAPAHPFFEQPWPEGDYRFFQIGNVVDDIIAAATKWTDVFGVGPFHVLPPDEQELVYTDGIRTIRLQIAVAQAGPVQIELIQQHCDTPGIYRDWSRNGVSTFHQLCAVTYDYDAKKMHLEALGYPVVAESLRGRFRVAYFDTADDFGFYTEVVEHASGFLDQLQSISATCASWDGTDPVRLLTRDGYRTPESSEG